MKKTIGLIAVFGLLLMAVAMADPQIIQEQNTLDRFRMTDASGNVDVSTSNGIVSMNPTFQYSYGNGRVYGSLALQGDGLRLAINNFAVNHVYYNTQQYYFAKHNSQIQFDRVRGDGVTYVFWDKTTNIVNIYAYRNDGKTFSLTLNVETPKCADYWSSRNPTIPMC